MRSKPARLVLVTLAFAVVSSALTACNRDVRKYAKVVCEEMRDPEISCTRGRRRTDTLSRNHVLVQFNACRSDKLMELFQRGQDPSNVDFSELCETAADMHGLTETRFFELDQQMVTRCQRGDEDACLIACCGEERPIQDMPTLPDITRGAADEVNQFLRSIR